MALETYLDSGNHLETPLVAPTRSTGGFLESLNSCVSSLHNDGSLGVQLASHLDSSLGNFSNSLHRMAQLNANLLAGDMNSTVLNQALSIGASSLVTDASLTFPSVAHLQRTGSTSADSYYNLSSPPISLSSDNLSPSIIDGSSIARQTASYQDQNFQQGHKRMQKLQQAYSPATLQTHQVSLPASINQETGTLTQMCKKPKLNMKKEDVLHQQTIHQLLQRQDAFQMQDCNPQLQALIQKHRLQSQQDKQILQSIPQMQAIHPHQELQMRYYMQQQVSHRVSAVTPVDSGICSRRLMQYMYHLRHRPPDNNIAYWRKFVAEYYAPCAKKRWCLSLYDNIGQHALGVFSQVAMEVWHCEICGSKLGKGFEAIFEIIPRLFKIKFESGVIDELLFLDLPYEHRFPSGLMMLEYGKAVQESVYEQFRVVCEGQLRIIFSHDLKILSWEFCAQCHEELLPRQLVAPQVSHLVLAAHKYQNLINENASSGILPQDLRSNCNMFLSAGLQLARNLELLLVNDLGFSKRYIRCLQIAEVVNSMKDLMTCSCDNNIGPIESLKNYAREKTTAEVQMRQMEEIEQVGSAHTLLTDRSKLAARLPGAGGNINDHCCRNIDGVSTGSEQAALAITDFCQKLLKQNSANYAMGTVKQEPSCAMGTVKQELSCSRNCAREEVAPSTLPDSRSSNPVLLPNSSNNTLTLSQPSPNSKNLQQQMVYALLQEMVTNRGQKGVQTVITAVKKEAIGEFDGNAAGTLPKRASSAVMVGNGPGLGDTRSAVGLTNVPGGVLGRTNSFNAAPDSSSARFYCHDTSIKRDPYLEDFHLAKVAHDMDHEYSENG